MSVWGKPLLIRAKGSASGSIASFADGAAAPLLGATVTIPVIQLGSGTPATDNIRPIVGRSGAKLFRTGRNLFGGTWLRDGVLANVNNSFTSNDYVQFSANATVNGQITKDVLTWYPAAAGGAANGSAFKQNTAYTFLMTVYKSNGIGTNLRINYIDGTNVRIPNVSEAGVKETSREVSSSNKTVSGLEKFNSSYNTRLYYDESGIFEGDLAANEFVPFVGDQYSVSWQTEAGTIYAGTIHIDTDGLVSLKVTKRMYLVDSADKLVSVTTASTGVKALRLKSVTNYVNNDNNMVSNQYSRVVTAAPSTSGAIRMTGGSIYIYDNRFTDLETAISLVTANPIQIVYSVGNPPIYTLSPVQISTLNGWNNVWSDAGDISVEYQKQSMISMS